MKNEVEIKTGQSDIGQWIYDRIVELYPICRSITGDGVRESLQILNKYIPVHFQEIPSGTQVFDWTVPKEWNIRDAWIKDASGRKVIDFYQSNLHVVNYSSPIRRKITLNELKSHLFTIPEYPDWIPYRTSYYRDTWGFCLTQNQLDTMSDNEYEICIDSNFNEKGSLTYGEYFIKGETDEEVLISSHICHPSMCNDNLSGICTALALAEWLGKNTKNRFSYRFLFAPGTIGAITWLAQNQEKVNKIKHGLILSGLGDSGALTYKRSRRGNAVVDRAVEHTLHHRSENYNIEEFSPYGYDERQFNSPGFNLPVGRLSRTPFGTYPEYHTSADNLEFINVRSLLDTFSALKTIIKTIDHNNYYFNTTPFCEPQLGKRGLYESIGDDELAMLWVLNLSDGSHDLLEIADRASVPFDNIHKIALRLERHGLLRVHSKINSHS